MSLTIRVLVCACVVLLAAASARSGEPESFPVPTPEQREQFRKGHLRIGGTSETLAAAEATIAAAQDDVDVLHYLLDLEFVPSTRRVTGSVTVTGKSLVNGFQHLVLDLATNMTVTQVRRGSTILTFTRPTGLLDITLDQPFDADQTFDVQVFYNGAPNATGFGSISWRKTSGGTLGTMVSTLSEPDGARSWWPCKDRPDDKATVEEWWTVPNTWTATGNGLLVATVPKTGSKTQFQWKMHDPMTTYLVSVAATVYSKFSQSYTTLTGGTMTIDHYVYPEHLANAQASFTPLPAMIAFYAQRFGEYPFVEDKYGMSEFPWGGAMEHSTNTSYGTALVNGGHNYDFIIAHELSHQWWGDAVSPQTWADVWLNEGFATYSEALWAENLGGPAGYRNYMNSFWSPSFSDSVYNPSNLFGSTVYDKGGWVQHMLRHIVGDGAFFNALRDWYANHTDGTGNTALYQATQEARYGATLYFFFQEWVYGTGEPSYEYGWTTADLGNGTHRNYVRIRQTQFPEGPFTMPVDLTLVTANGNQVRTVVNDQLDQDFTLDTTSPLVGLLFDDQDWILAASKTVFALPDADGDGVPDRNDNCVGAANPTQLDFDVDDAGDACDPDDDNDGLVDVDDCASFDASQGAVGLVNVLYVGRSAETAQLTWDAAARAESYDVQRGTLVELRAGSYGACLASPVGITVYDDLDLPAADDGFFYLVRGHDAGCGGGGSLGTDGNGAPRPSACP